jgi:hypothetical protein
MTDYKEIDDALALIEKMCTAEQSRSMASSLHARARKASD